MRSAELGAFFFEMEHDLGSAGLEVRKFRDGKFAGAVGFLGDFDFVGQPSDGKFARAVGFLGEGLLGSNSGSQ